MAAELRRIPSRVMNYINFALPHLQTFPNDQSYLDSDDSSMTDQSLFNVNRHVEEALAKVEKRCPCLMNSWRKHLRKHNRKALILQNDAKHGNFWMPGS